ncbi:NADPH oxidase 1-like [Patiria miniata]|uniref:FAD-binding FR-type domain-containing protein n=1 Tax=Patiria miniata TaxID=46514 RepID=A0A914BLW3_PATMI|nr:NADPH oxidase 1-like [Patiria miniata]XP_038076921.1 NADPH oxidase 1-like [Patiria miniata]
MSDRLINEGVKWMLVFLWLLANLVTWLASYLTYANSDEFFYMRHLMGASLPVARASATCLNLNSMMILLPVCRNIISFFRGSCETNRYYRRNLRRQLDKNITFHKVVAYLVVFFTIIHVVSHCFNSQNLYNSVTSESGPLAALLSLIRTESGKPLNPIQVLNKSPYGLTLIDKVLQLLPGWTGAVLTLVLIVMFSSSTEFIRRSYFETFWFTHHLFFLYFAMILAHGAQGIVSRQSNVAVHDPKKCSETFAQWPTDECPDPTFVNGSAGTWKWLLFPIVCYIFERIFRIYRAWQTIIITKVVQHPSSVIELQMKKQGFKMLPGQYVFLLCPSISRFQWHPFTLTSSPEEDYLSVHIRTVGDWTNKLREKVGADEGEQSVAKLPSIAIDGPFGTASIDIFEYEVGICIGAGIGVTPFASILKSISHKVLDPENELKLKKVYFFWICRDTNAFEWFTEMLSSLESMLIENGQGDFLEYHIYLSRGWSHRQAKNIYLQEEQAVDAITGLRQKTNYGRPKWDETFKMLAETHPAVHAGVFFCGPKNLSTVLHKCCNRYSSFKQDGCRFFYNKENF